MFLNTPYYIKEEAFSKSFCEGVITQGDNQEKTEAVIADGDNNNRKSNITWLKNDNLTEQLTLIVNEVNTNTDWNFLLKEFEPLQYSMVIYRFKLYFLCLSKRVYFGLKDGGDIPLLQK